MRYSPTPLSVEVHLWKSSSGLWSALIPGDLSRHNFKDRKEALGWATWHIQSTEYDRYARENPEIVQVKPQGHTLTEEVAGT